MKNLNVFNTNTHAFLDEIIASKKYSPKDPHYKTRIDLLVPNVRLCYDNFDLAHTNNNQQILVAHGYVDIEKGDLLKLYNPKAKKLVEFKNSTTTILDNRASNVCQYCTINSANTLDHIVPKSEFAEFSVNPKNLLPACSECNGYKLNKWKENNNRLFLNLYNDILPIEQYLFVDFSPIQNNVEVNFRLSNINNIDINLFNLIKSHYSSLHLLIRFKRKSNDIISELVNSINASKVKLNQNDTVEVIRAKINADKVILGNNHYKLILEETIINDNAFISTFFV